MLRGEFGIMGIFTDEKLLLQAIKNGDNQAFEFLFKSYYPRLRGYASRFLHDEEAVRDIIQESFLKFWERRHLIEAISLSSLLFAMVRNACMNYLKHIQLVEQQPLDYLQEMPGREDLYCWDFGLDPEHALLYKELQQEVDTVINNLPERCREVFVMSRFKRMKNREIAEALQISTTAVEKHISKALKQFADYFKDRYSLDIYIAILAWILK